MQDEESIVRAAQSGDSEAFSVLYEQHFDKVYRYMVIRVGDRAESEDMTQQVFVKAFEALPSYKWQGAPFSAWLFRIAHNQVVDRQRKLGKQKTESLEESKDSLFVSEADLQSSTEVKLAVEEVVAAAKGLTPAQREVLGLRFGAELSTAEVARLMGKSEGAVKALQHAAVVALRKALKRE